MLSRAIDKKPLVWRATLSELAKWWRWRSERRWLVISHDDHHLDIQFDEWDTDYGLAMEIHRGRFRCTLPVASSRMSLRPQRSGLRADRGIPIERGPLRRSTEVP